MNLFCIITAVFMFVYIGIEPFLPDIIGSVATLCVGYVADALGSITAAFAVPLITFVVVWAFAFYMLRKHIAA